jgi:N-acetylmuramoyl-L-alanine amidase
LTILLWNALSAHAQEPSLGDKSTRQIHCMGQSWKIAVIATSVEGELLVKADHPSLMAVARAMGRDLVWSPSALTLRGDAGLTLGLGQRSLLGRPLPVAPRMVDEAVQIPISSLEELLSCRITVKPGARGAIYVEPTIRSISFSEDGPTGTVLRIHTTVPVRQKVMKLRNPARTVIDLIGVAPPRGSNNLTHPVLGEIRVAQNQPAPSVTRVVIPMPSGVKVSTPKSFDLFEHRAEIAWKKGTQGAPAAAARPTPAPVRAAIPGAVRPAPSATVKIPPAAARQPVAQGEPSRGSNGEDPDGRQSPPSTPAGNSSRPLLLDASWQGEQLKLTFSRPVTFRWSRLSGGQDRFVVDFPGVIFPAKRTTLASSVAGLEAVRIVQNMPEPNPVVRLVCDLQGPMAVTTVPGEGKELFLEFPGRLVSSGGAKKGAGQTEKPKPGSVSGRTICLDAGHGGSDPGAQNRTYGISEKQITLDITLRLADMLRAEGWNVVMTRTNDRDVSYAGSTDREELGARSDLANQQNTDLFISIHCNSSANASVGGTSIHWYKAEDYVLAKSLENEVLVATGRTPRGLIKDRFFVLAHTEMPAVLIETAFISSNEEGALLADPDYRERIAQGIAAGLRAYAATKFPLSAAGK